MVWPIDFNIGNIAIIYKFSLYIYLHRMIAQPNMVVGIATPNAIELGWMELLSANVKTYMYDMVDSLF